MSADDDLRAELLRVLIEWESENYLHGSAIDGGWGAAVDTAQYTYGEVADALLPVVRAKLAEAWSEALTIAEESANDLDADGHMKNPRVLLELLEDRVKAWRD